MNWSLRGARSVSFGFFLVSGCAGGQNPGNQGARIRYEPPPELPAYEMETREDPLLALEALESPETPPPEAPEATGGGALEEAEPGSSSSEAQEPASVSGGAATDGPPNPL